MKNVEIREQEALEEASFKCFNIPFVSSPRGFNVQKGPVLLVSRRTLETLSHKEKHGFGGARNQMKANSTTFGKLHNPLEAQSPQSWARINDILHELT